MERTDWYEDILTGAMKYLQEEEEVKLSNPDRILVDEKFKVVVQKVPAKGQTTFGHVIKSAPIGSLRGAVLGSFAQKATVLNYPVTREVREGVSYVVIGDTTNELEHSDLNISDEEIEDKITSQLSAVMEESIIELKQMRLSFNEKTREMSSDFNKRLLALSGRKNGDTQ